MLYINRTLYVRGTLSVLIVTALSKVRRIFCTTAHLNEVQRGVSDIALIPYLPLKMFKKSYKCMNCIKIIISCSSTHVFNFMWRDAALCFASLRLASFALFP